jgi:hypothetical protein
VFCCDPQTSTIKNYYHLKRFDFIEKNNLKKYIKKMKIFFDKKDFDLKKSKFD